MKSVNNTSESPAGIKGWVLERHVQTILVSVVTVGITAIFVFSFNTNADVRVLQSKLDNVLTTLEDVRGDLKEERLNNTVAIKALETRLYDLQTRVVVLEKGSMPQPRSNH